jgi:hypothetical protein
MARRVFYSFHYKPDNWRASQVRNIGVIEGNVPVSDNDWEKVTKSGDEAIKKWIADQMYNRSCVVVLVGENTAERKWINYEIIEGWKSGKGVVGICIYNLKDVNEKQSSKGKNPFDFLTFGDKKFSSVVKLYDPPYTTSTYVYDHIKTNISDWVEEAVKIRGKYN